MQQAQNLWNAALVKLRELVDADSFERYFAEIVPVTLDESRDTLILGVTSDLIAFWLSDNYGGVVEEALREVCDDSLEVVFESGHQLASLTTPAVRKRVEGDKDETSTATATAVAVEERPRPRVRSRESHDDHDGGDYNSNFPYRGDFSFDNFVVGNCNKICFAAAQAVSEKPGRAYNPLLIFGGVALGKTHLLQAIATNVIARKKRAKVQYVTSEEFVNQYVEALQSKKLGSFRRRFRSLDLLLIDDIQFFEGKVGSQEEFFHTFNALHNSHKQIVLASDRTPQQIAGLEQRLVSRFEWGLSAEMLPPDFETRLAILRNKQEKQQIKLSDEVMTLIANRIHSNIRNLESALTRLVMNISAFSDNMTVERAEMLLKDKFEQERKPTINIELIQRQVADHFDISRSDMMSKKRPRKIALPRMVAMYLSRKLTSDSLPAIGDAFNRNHATVIHAVDKVEQLMSADDSLRNSVSILKRDLES